MPIKMSVPIVRTPDGFIKVGDSPYTKWTVTTNSEGDKVYSLEVKQNIGDTPKVVIGA